MPRLEMYKLMLSAKLVISIPASDSSPRSVYEAIFCGCFAVVTHNEWLDLLPDCMASRIIVADISSPTWLKDAIKYAEDSRNRPYVPSSAALELFDQKQSMYKIYNNIYPSVLA